MPVMTFKIEYIKGDNTGAITDVSYADKKEYLAVTASSKKIFKTFKGAQQWMTQEGYVENGSAK